MIAPLYLMWNKDEFMFLYVWVRAGSCKITFVWDQIMFVQHCLYTECHICYVG